MDETEAKKPRERSKEYPLYDIPFCVDLTESINSKLGNRYSSIAQLSKTFGKSETYIASQLSASKQYNLLDLKKGEGYKPTDTFFKVTRGRTTEDKRDALINCIKSPAIYGDFIAKYDGQELPSDLPSIFYWDYKITEAAKDNAAKIFLDNLNYLSLISSDGKLIVSKEPIKVAEPETPDNGTGDPKVIPPATPPFIPQGGLNNDSDKKKADIKIKNGRFVSLEFPKDLSDDDIDRIINTLNTWRD